MQKNSLKCDVLVIGGGAAGMMAAISASESGAKVVLLEKNAELGIKLMMTGKGRCNITNAETDKRKFLEVFGRNGKFLYSAFNDFGPEETVRFFTERGLTTKVERGNRIFPMSDKAEDVRGVLMDELRRNKILVLRGAKVLDLVARDSKIVKARIESVDINEIGFKNIVIATGGLSYPSSGSSGDGFLWAEKLGHRVISPKPALTAVLLKERWVEELEGLSLKNVKVGVYQDAKKQDERFGEAIFTERGISGPVVLDMSKKIGELLESGSVKIIIDFKPALEFAELDLRIQRDFGENQNKIFKNSLDELLPQKMIPVVISLSGIDPQKKINLVTREERKKLVHLLKEMDLEVAKLLGFDKAVITSGGVSLREVDPKTMRSKVVDNLYFAGEVLDLDAPTGGYNLQEAWSTGHLAGKSAGENVAAGAV
ncbi:MAG: NAD(P)/FAD-dependent oxidoreductase [Candidatus Pacebacteria bacterium]|nr:NAD(P)/FAD-dependent oxidoreductase [Candidatus Paceibacterota bacterium]